MSADSGKMCRVCLAPQKSSKFNLIFKNNGKYAKQIFDLTGIKMMEYEPNCPALICPRCTANLHHACLFRSAIRRSNKKFVQIYKNYDDLCQDHDSDSQNSTTYIIQVSDDEMPSDMIKIEDEVCSSATAIDKNDSIIEIDIKSDPEDEIDCEVVEIKDVKIRYRKNSNEFELDDLSDDLVVALDIGDHMDEYKLKLAGITVFLCTICGCKSNSEDELQEHMAVKHNERKRKRIEGDDEASEMEWMCSYCGMMFSSKFEMNQHRWSEHWQEEQSSICRFCDEKFPKSHHLRVHIKYTHLEEPFVCPKCNEKFSHQDSFKAHLKTERDFICDHCSAPFLFKQQLDTHKYEQHSRPHLCKHCSFRFEDRKLLRSHIEAAHPIKAFRCGTCFESFVHKNELMTHLKRESCKAEVE